MSPPLPGRYVLLPNKLPPKRFEAHLEVHAGSVDERPSEQAGPRTCIRSGGVGRRVWAIAGFWRTAHVLGYTVTLSALGQGSPAVLLQFRLPRHYPPPRGCPVVALRRSVAPPLNSTFSASWRSLQVIRTLSNLLCHLPPSSQGVAHLVEHVTFLGSKRREDLLGTGARANAYTDFHHTVFHVHAPAVNGITGQPMLPQVRRWRHA